MQSHSSLGTLLVLNLLCGCLSAVLEKKADPGWEALAAEREALNDHGGSDTYRTSSIDSEAIELDIGSDIKPGLFPLDINLTKQTVLLVDGEASKRITYVLNLRSKEKLLGVLHVTNDSDVITTHSKQVREISGAPAARYNISLEHEFEGSVGVASYILHVTTSYARYIASGTFYVSGIVAMIHGDDSSQALVSGIGSPGLSFANPDAVKLKNSSTGQVPLTIVYQAPGPDVMETSLSLSSIMNSAKFHVQDSGTEMEAPLLNFNANECRSVSDVEKDETGYFLFPNSKCGIGFHAASNELVINVNRERSGTVVITVSIPLLNAGHEMFETSINIFIGHPSVIKPVLLLDESLDLVLDHYGTEEFSVNMYNTVTPAQSSNATAYYMNLPGMRYAAVDFKKSKMTNPVQIIVFKTVTTGEEDDRVLKLIQAADGSSNHAYVDLAESLSDGKNGSASSQNESQSNDAQMPLNVSLVPEEPKNDTSVAVRVKNDNTLVDEMLGDVLFKAGSLYDPSEFRDIPEHNFRPQSVFRMETVDQRSNIYVVIPPNENPIKAVSSGQGAIRTAVASQELAIIDSAEIDLPEKVFVIMALEGYSVGNFSEHKSAQIKMALLNEAIKVKNGTIGEVRLVKLRNEGAKLTAEYEVFVSGNSVEIADRFLEREISAGIARQTYLEENRVEIISTMASASMDVPGNLAGGDSSSTTLSASSSGVIIAAIVVLSLVVAIPLFALCFGFVVTRRHQQENEASDMNMGDSTTGVAAHSEAADEPSSPQIATSPIARDGFGRGDDITDESFKMQKELFKDGYYEDNKPSSSTTKED